MEELGGYVLQGSLAPSTSTFPVVFGSFICSQDPFISSFVLAE